MLSEITYQIFVQAFHDLNFSNEIANYGHNNVSFLCLQLNRNADLSISLSLDQSDITRTLVH